MVAANTPGQCVVLAFVRRISYKPMPMHHGFEILIGCGMIGFSLAGITGLTLWSRKIIEQIADSDRQTARHLIKQRNGDQ